MIRSKSCAPMCVAALLALAAVLTPATFIVVPGEYRIRLQEVRGESARMEVTAVVEKGATVERLVELP